MSKVKRYECNGSSSVFEDENGSLVDYGDYAALEAKCAALAAQNAAFKDINAWCKTDAFSNMYREFKTAEAVGCCNTDCMHDAMVVAIMHAPEAPATDAFLAEVRAQGLEMYADNLDNGEDDAERGGFDYAVKFLRSEASGVRLLANQLRKGGEQK